MMDTSVRKVIQKQAYDILSHKYGLLLIIVGMFVLVVSAFHFGETVVDWSREKYAAIFNSFSDNIGAKSFRKRLCLPVPIDVVYTWVNGTDPSLVDKLRRAKVDIEQELNISRIISSKGLEKCTFSNCLPTKMVVLDPVLPSEMTLTQFIRQFPSFSEVKKMFVVTSPNDDRLNFTVMTFDNETYVQNVLTPKLIVNGKNTTVKRSYYTTDWTVQHGVMLKDTIIMSGFPHKYNEDELKTKLPVKYQKGITKIDLDQDKGVAVIHIPKKEDFEELLEEKNITIDGKDPTLNAANLIWDLRDFSRDEDTANSRFEDNEELRYSLRSVETFAPWVRHIYIVTNGQIPHWLDLENPRVSIITHEEIFPNKSHLPTFSSPAIESHLHRIPGLSDKFIYLNDDVMFGTDVWPDDFFSFSSGQKVHLTWPVPNCNEGCPSTWIRDSYCDKACNNSECEWDGGDCNGTQRQVQLGAGFHGDFSDTKFHTLAYCNSGCANNWIADKYCDTACNVKQCGFDAGDCGTKNFYQLHEIVLSNEKTNYVLPPGEKIVYFNLTEMLTKDGKTVDANYENTEVIRQVAVCNKFMTMTLILQAGHNKTTLPFHLKGHRGSLEKLVEVNFTVTVDTNTTLIEHIKVPSNNTNGTTEAEDEADEVLVIQEVPPGDQKPHVSMIGSKQTVVNIGLPSDFDRNLTHVNLTKPIRQKLDLLLKALHDGDLTEKGFRIHWFSFYQKYQEHIGKPIPRLPAYLKQKLDLPQHVQVHNKSKVRGENSLDQNEPKHGFRKLLSTYAERGHDSGIEKMQTLADKNKAEISNREFLKLVEIGDDPMNLMGALPWEGRTSMENLRKQKDQLLKARKYETTKKTGRMLLDTFGDSLRHVNKVYNKAFGYSPRKVPAHMPHMIDKHIMAELQAKFPEEWDTTSSHQIRHSKDMQYAFSYFYYLLGVMEDMTPEKVFDIMDTDKSRSLSDREIRTFAAQANDLPLYLETLQGLEAIFVNCSRDLPEEKKVEFPPPPEESYYDKKMPQVTRKLFINCEKIQELVKDKFKPTPKYKYTIVDDSDVAFKMIRTNVSNVVGQLDDIRKNPKKFVCLNDDIDHGSEEAKTVKAILQDFYESLFPVPSQFELPREYRNRFLHVNELKEWRQYRNWLRFWTHLALVVLIIFAIASFFGDKIEAAHRRLSRLCSRPDSERTSRSTKPPSPSTSQEESRPKTKSPILTV